MRTSLFKRSSVRVGSTPTQPSSSVLGLLPAIVLCAGLGLAAVPSTAFANNPPPSVRADAPNVYVVKRGDTLWAISKRYLRDAWRWPEIWASNPQVRNPHLIYPGDRILLCRVQGRSVVGIDAGDGCDGVIRRMGAVSTGTDQLSPRIRVEPLDVAVSLIPLADIKNWLTSVRVVDYQTLQTAPYVLAAKGRRVITAVGDTLYVRGAGLAIGEHYGVYREGERYVDPDTQKILGYEARQVARGIVTEITGEVTSIRLTESIAQEVREGDRILREEAANLPNTFYPTNAEGVRPARLMRVMDSIGTAAAKSVIALNRGEQDGVKAGHVFAVYRRGALILDPKQRDVVRMPSERAGLAMVFRTFGEMSYAYVLEAAEPISVGDELRPAVRAD